MGKHLLEANVLFYKYTCEFCNKSIYCDYDCMDSCPHCGIDCSELTRESKEKMTEVIYYEIDPKSGEIFLYKDDGCI